MIGAVHDESDRGKTGILDRTRSDLIAIGQKLLERVRSNLDVTFVHVKGHKDDEGNE